MPEGESTAATTATTGGGDGSGMVPVQLAALVPTYDPAKDDITIFQQKVELLVETWPSSRMIELATRLVLNTSGTAFQKLQLNQSAILVNDKKGVMKLIELLGGSWGRIPLEKKFEAAEKAIYRLQQKGDEANDSYLALQYCGKNFLAKVCSYPNCRPILYFVDRYFLLRTKRK